MALDKIEEALSPVRVEPALRRGLSRAEAARYIGVSASKFDELVRDRQMPKPVRIGSRTIWDLRKLDAAFDVLSDMGGESANPWD